MTRPPNLALHLLSVIFVCFCAVTADAQKECQEGDPLGATYLGKKSVTASGLSCQVWATSTPHKHQYTDQGDHNHCRNPDESFDGGVWCYTTDPNKRWEQGCISCGILVSGIGARGVSSEHMENMEMFSCSPT